MQKSVLILYYYLLGIFLLSFPTCSLSYILFPKFDSSEKNDFFHSINKRNFISSLNSDSEPSPGIVIRLTEKLSKLFISEKSKEYLMKQFHGFTTPDFQFKALQMNVNIYKTSLVKAESPEINFKSQNSHSFSIKTSGGFAQFRGLYKGVYRTCRDGQVYIDLSGLNLSLKVDLTRSNENKFIPKISSCEFSVNEIFVEMKRPLFPQAIDSFKQIFLEYLSKEMCTFAQNYAEKIGDKFQETIENSPISLKEFGLHKFDSSLIREPILDKNSLFFALNGKFGEKEENERSRVEIFENDSSHMIYTYVSDFVFNEFLKSFKNKEIKIEKSAKLNVLLNGQNLENSENSMDIKIKFNEAPKIEFMDYGAKLLLNFNAVLKSSSDEILVSANFKLKTLIEKFEINALLDSASNSDNDYKLKTKVTIDDIEITDIISFLPEAFNLAEKLPAAIKANKDIFEEIIECNLHSLFPIETNSYLRVTTIKGFFRSRTLIFGFDFASDGHLIRHLQLP